jgi:hypothetical protein
MPLPQLNVYRHGRSRRSLITLAGVRLDVGDVQGRQLMERTFTAGPRASQLPEEVFRYSVVFEDQVDDVLGWGHEGPASLAEVASPPTPTERV